MSCCIFGPNSRKIRQIECGTPFRESFCVVSSFAIDVIGCLFKSPEFKPNAILYRPVTKELENNFIVVASVLLFQKYVKAEEFYATRKLLS
ncbi:uncharacterized protein PHALS_02412 [Plasmopara halstedii]|uniref:Uncharacterized protein n=1 Tax=Plasmopara halstedii TaxID=4781 RepID=A0A0P1A7B6_PLAHL|nr:uncharacterized protein PHALS_02412 [Plasmopara halstedii]CEG36320.1 hypothetical protein PHALS_02412 [Plasmopara halstedii]|eukprot:XP_024572689.1 hypothetical protein PHALS_02412 [Plasmopara halstedii]